MITLVNVWLLVRCAIVEQEIYLKMEIYTSDALQPLVVAYEPIAQ